MGIRKGTAGGGLGSAKQAAASLVALLLAACTTDGGPELGKGLHCVDDSPGCLSERSATLANIMADKQKKWVREPAPAAAYASGVRLFAYKQRKRELTCEELTIGRKEADAGPNALRELEGKGLTTAQVARGVMLSQEVSRELSNELKRRCRT